MSSESYRYDETLGLYGYTSHRIMAKGVIRDLVLYDENHEATELLATFPHLGIDITPGEEFRIGSLVESSDARLGYALAVAPPSPSAREVIGGMLYCVDREVPEVSWSRELVVDHPDTYQNDQDYQDALERLQSQFDKTELEAIMRMLGKMITSLQVSARLRAAENDEAVVHAEGSIAHARQVANTRRDEEILRRTAPVEPYVLSALYNHRQHAVRALFSRNRLQSNLVPASESAESSSEHITEWQDFIDRADELVSQKVDPREASASVNIQYEQADKSYYLKLAVEYGQLIGVQILCDDTGAWQSQSFDLRPIADEAAGSLNHVSSMWNRDEILHGLGMGEIISDDIYEYYRSLAEQSLTAKFKSKSLNNLIQLPVHSKRPAA